MNDSSKPDKTTKTKPARRQHVAVRLHGEHTWSAPAYDEIVVFGQKIDALEHIVDHGRENWRYVAVSHGQSVAEALKVVG